MNIRKSALLSSKLFFLLMLCIHDGGSYLAHRASAQGSFSRPCIEEYTETNRRQQPLGIERSEAEKIIQDVARSVGISSSVTIIPCRFGKIESNYISPDRASENVPTGEYITYNPVWIREVIGQDRIQLIAILGHELGHLINRHFTANSHLSLEQKETQADRFAGCAVARMKGDWRATENLFSRIRQEIDSQYPSRLKSLSEALAGFRSCGGSVQPNKEVSLKATPQAFCSNVKSLLDMTQDSFFRIRSGEPEEGTWNSSFKMPGFERCNVGINPFSYYTCFSETVQNRNSAVRIAENFMRDTQACLGISWMRTREVTGGEQLRSPSDEKFMAIRINEIPWLMGSRRETRYYTTFTIGDMRRSSIPEPTISSPAVATQSDRFEIPKDYCEDLKRAVSLAPKGFRDLLGRRTGSYNMSRLQIKGWSNCSIHDLPSQSNPDRKYLSCDTPDEQNKQFIQDTILRIAAEVLNCIGESWVRRNRRHSSGIQIVEFTSVDDGTEVEIRARESLEAWRVVLDINQAR